MYDNSVVLTYKEIYNTTYYFSSVIKSMENVNLTYKKGHSSILVNMDNINFEIVMNYTL